MTKAIVLFYMAAVVGASAAPFQNLGFDEANTNGGEQKFRFPGMADHRPMENVVARPV